MTEAPEPQAIKRLHRFILISKAHHSQEVTLAALDDLEAIATELGAIPAQIATAQAAAVASSEAALEAPIAAIKTNVAAIVAALEPAPVVQPAPDPATTTTS